MAPTPAGTNGHSNGHANGHATTTRSSDLLRRSRPARVGRRRHMPLPQEPPTMRELPLIIIRLLLAAIVVAPAVWFSLTTLTGAIADAFSHKGSSPDCALVPATPLGPPNCSTGPD